MVGENNKKGVNELGENSLHQAVIAGDLNKVEEILAGDEYRQAGAIDQQVEGGSKNNGKTALHIAISGKSAIMAQLLLGYGANINSKDKIDTLPLEAAIIDGNKEMVELLLKNGADPNQKGAYKDKRAIDFAVDKNNKEIVDMLLDSKDVTKDSGKIAGLMGLGDRISFNAHRLLKSFGLHSDEDVKLSYNIETKKLESAFPNSSVPPVLSAVASVLLLPATLVFAAYKKGQAQEQELVQEKQSNQVEKGEVSQSKALYQEMRQEMQQEARREIVHENIAPIPTPVKIVEHQMKRPQKAQRIAGYSNESATPVKIVEHQMKRPQKAEMISSKDKKDVHGKHTENVISEGNGNQITR